MRISIGSSSDGQVYMGTNWLKDLNENINALNRNIQQNMHQLQQRIHNTVQFNLERAHRLTENLGTRFDVKFFQFLLDSLSGKLLTLLYQCKRSFHYQPRDPFSLSLSFSLSIFQGDRTFFPNNSYTQSFCVFRNWMT